MRKRMGPCRDSECERRMKRENGRDNTNRPSEKHRSRKTTIIRVNCLCVETTFSGPEHKIMVFVVYSNNVLLWSGIVLNLKCPLA